MSCRTNHLPHSTMVTGEDALLSWWNVASRGPRAYGYVLLVVLTFSRSTLFSAHPSLSSPSLLKVPRHVFGDTAQNYIVASSFVARASSSPTVHGGLLDCTFYSSVYQEKLWYFFLWFLFAPLRREEVSLPLSHPARGIRLQYDLGLFSHIFINGAHGVSSVFKVARRQWRVADGHCARGSKLCRARPQTWWSDFVRFPDTQRASSEGFQFHVADSSCSLSLRDHCDGHWETSVLAQLRRGSWSWCSYAVSLICSVC